MTTLRARPRTALLVIDVQQGVVASAHQRDAGTPSRPPNWSLRGYDVTLVADAHTTDDTSAWGAPPPDQVIAHTNLYRGRQSAPGRTAAVTETKEVAFGGR